VTELTMPGTLRLDGGDGVKMMDEIDLLLNKADRDSVRMPHTMPLSA
jgi:hypothetical protein